MCAEDWGWRMGGGGGGGGKCEVAKVVGDGTQE